MLENRKNLYEAFMSKDTRLDGKFFVGIASTGIYCRPICRAKKPKPENCTFYASASEAELNGYRPCLLCRPELAPGFSVMDSASSIAYSAARLLEENSSLGLSITEIAEKTGYTDRHLRRIFMAEYNVSPIQYLQTYRLLLAKQLLTDTKLPITDVAMAAGFHSLRSFNDAFKKHYNLKPTAIRKSSSRVSSNAITLKLSYRPPYLWEDVLSFLKSRAIKGIELIENNEYMRTVQLVSREGKDVIGYLKVSSLADESSLALTISESLLPVLAQVIARVRNLFDLYCDPYTIYESLESIDTVKAGARVLGTRVPGSFDPFEMAVRAILGQQISVKAASTLAGRMVEALADPIDTGIADLTHSFPSPWQILSHGEDIQERLGVLGIISARSRTIYDLAEKITKGEVNLETGSDVKLEIDKLRKIKGIGKWTAHYIAMRTMGYTDAFLETDLGIIKAFAPKIYSPEELLEIAEAWRPWRSYATISLWNTL